MHQKSIGIKLLKKAHKNDLKVRIQIGSYYYRGIVHELDIYTDERDGTKHFLGILLQSTDTSFMRFNYIPLEKMDCVGVFKNEQ